MGRFVALSATLVVCTTMVGTPENFYVLSNGDPIRLTVKGTTFKARARF